MQEPYRPVPEGSDGTGARNPRPTGGEPREVGHTAGRLAGRLAASERADGVVETEGGSTCGDRIGWSCCPRQGTSTRENRRGCCKVASVTRSGGKDGCEMAELVAAPQTGGGRVGAVVIFVAIIIGLHGQGGGGRVAPAEAQQAANGAAGKPARPAISRLQKLGLMSDRLCPPQPKPRIMKRTLFSSRERLVKQGMVCHGTIRKRLTFSARQQRPEMLQLCTPWRDNISTVAARAGTTRRRPTGIVRLPITAWAPP